VLFSASSKSSGGGNQHKSHRLLRLVPSPSRAVTFTPDGALLIAGNDNGMICVWDVSGNNTSSGAMTAPVLVHHVLRAHSSWILNLVCLPDSRRFVTVGAERQMHVWNVGQLTAPLHTFQLDSAAWTVAIPSGRVSTKPPHSSHPTTRMVTGSDSGWLQVFSLAS
jgi:WD40 repeat protein